MRRNAATLIAITLLAAAILAVMPGASASGVCTGTYETICGEVYDKTQCEQTTFYNPEDGDEASDCVWDPASGCRGDQGDQGEVDWTCQDYTTEHACKESKCTWGSDEAVSCSEIDAPATCDSRDDCEWEGTQSTSTYEYTISRSSSCSFPIMHATCIEGDTRTGYEEVTCSSPSGPADKTYQVTCDTNNEVISFSGRSWVNSCPSGWSEVATNPLRCEVDDPVESTEGTCIEKDDPPDETAVTCQELRNEGVFSGGQTGGNFSSNYVTVESISQNNQRVENGKAIIDSYKVTWGVEPSIEAGISELFVDAFFHDGNNKIDCDNQYLGWDSDDDGDYEGGPCEQAFSGQIAFIHTIQMDGDEELTASACIVLETPPEITSCDEAGVDEACPDGSWNGTELKCIESEEANQDNICCPAGNIIDENGQCAEPPTVSDDDPAHIINVSTPDGLRYFACGDHWENKQSNVEYVPLCTNKEDYDASLREPGRFHCSVTPQGVNWTQTHENISQHLAAAGENINPWRVIDGVESVRYSEATPEGKEALEHAGHNPATLDVSLICRNGQVSTATTKQNPKATSLGFCSNEQCFARGRCYEPGMVNGEYFCAEAADQAQWTSFASVLAEEMISNVLEVNGEARPFSLNCGKLSTTTNYRSELENSFCELAVYKSTSTSSTEIDYVLTGAIIEEEDPGDYITRGHIFDQLERNITLPDWFTDEIFVLHEEDFNNVVNPEAPYLHYDVLPTNYPLGPEHLLVILTNKNSFDERDISFWQWLKEQFTTPTQDISLKFATAEQFSIDTKFDREAIISYDTTSGCEGNRIMRLDASSQGNFCYDENQYRRYIQGR